MIFRVCLGRIQKVTWNLEYLVDVTCRGNCRKCDFKLYKMQTKSENHETCRCVVLSHVEAVVKNCKGFEQIVTSDTKNPDISICDHCDHMWKYLSFWHPTSQLARNMSRYLSETCWGTFRQVPRHVTSTRCSRFHVSSWIRPKHTLNIMSINFWMTKVHYSMYLQFKFEISQKIRRNEIN